MEGQIKSSLGKAHPSLVREHHLDRTVLIYWGCSLIAGMVLLRDWLAAWHVPQTLAQPALVVFLIVSYAAAQLLYLIVARHDGRPLSWGSTLIFALGNGFFETLAFAAAYRLGAIIGSAVVGLFAPDAASAAGFGLGLVFFIIYGGLIHGLFWLRILPPHLDDAPLSRRIRKIRPIFEVGLVLGWSLVFWLYQDIWTVVAIHVLVDLGLMWRVRPPLFLPARST